MPRPEEVLVAVIGAGGVGAVFLQQLAWLAARRTSPRIRVIYVANIDRALYYPDYRTIDADKSVELLESPQSLPPPQFDEILTYLSNAPGRVIVADNTSSQFLAESYPKFLSKGISIITPNKKAFSGTYALWTQIFETARKHEAYVYHESSVGAGMPIISTLNDLVLTGDRVTRIEGVFSGTMSYLFNNFSPVRRGGKTANSSTTETKKKWSEEVRKAKQLGYTEPDPRDDLNGLDVARKLTILGRIAGLPIESPTSFPVQSLIPKPLESCATSDEFIDRLAEFDGEMENEKLGAEQEGKVVRFVGSINFATKDVRVGLERFEPSHPIASLQGSDNIISFYTERYGKELPLTIRGAGAGADVTAMGVSGDLLKILNQIC